MVGGDSLGGYGEGVGGKGRYGFAFEDGGSFFDVGFCESGFGARGREVDGGCGTEGGGDGGGGVILGAGLVSQNDVGERVGVGGGAVGDDDFCSVLEPAFTDAEE